MTTALIIGGVLLVGLGMVSSQLFRLKDWLARQPAVPNPHPDIGSELDHEDDAGKSAPPPAAP